MIRALALLLMAPAQAGAFELAFPADCKLGDTCFIQQFFDHDASIGVADFTCGPLAYDGHDGTDIALPSLAAMNAGTDVIAASPGTVIGIRDGMPDIAANDPAAPSVENRECGNGVLVDHGDGWQTQYCHMRQGSIIVKTGQQVATGTPLGLVGMSGLAEFPHLHISVRKDGAELDPFAPGLQSCGIAAGEDLWQPAIPYAPGGIVAAGFSAGVPEFEAIKAGLPDSELTSRSPALVIWAHLFGGQAGDIVSLGISGPEGSIIAERIILDRTQARLFRAAGKRLKTAGWALGDYRGEAILTRNGVLIDQFNLVLHLLN